MAANLLAEFEDFYQSHTPAYQFKLHGDQGGGCTRHADAAALSSGIRDQSAPSIGQQYEAELDDFGDFVTTVKEIKYETDSRRSTVVPKVEPKLSRKVKERKIRDQNVLFDAEEDAEDEAEDDFGAFEGEETSANSYHRAEASSFTEPGRSAVESLIDFEDISTLVPGASQQTVVPTGLSAYGGNHFDFGESYTSKKNLASTIGAEQRREPELEQYDDSAWDDFNDSTSRIGTPPQSARTNQHDAVSTVGRRSCDVHSWTQEQATKMILTLDTLLEPSNKVKPDMPPTNIPPPAILLNRLSSIATEAFKQFFGPISRFNAVARERYLQDDEARHYLESLLSIIIVLARIIAGRKLRWKRDTLLSQSMRIGPASTSGKSGGMKLTGLDKAESAKEDRDVEEAIRCWKAQIGRLKSAVNVVGRLQRVAELSQTYLVRTVTPNDGAVVSPKACALCGLKRNERITKIDLQVQDSFGEWWTEHWGHNDCMRFWERQKHSMKAL